MITTIKQFKINENMNNKYSNRRFKKINENYESVRLTLFIKFGDTEDAENFCNDYGCIPYNSYVEMELPSTSFIELLKDLDMFAELKELYGIETVTIDIN